MAWNGTGSQCRRARAVENQTFSHLTPAWPLDSTSVNIYYHHVLGQHQLIASVFFQCAVDN